MFRRTSRPTRSPRLVHSARAAIVGAIVAGSMLTAVANAAYPGNDGRIAFVKSGDIYSVNPNGTGLRILATSGQDSDPRWSSRGTQIAYIDRGNLWIMNANGSNKTQVTSAAPMATDSRPSWSPNGRYLAFVKTARHAATGHLVRYDTQTGTFADFTTTVNPPGLVDVTALPAPVAWSEASNAAGTPGYFIIFEGAGALCQAGHFCLDALGLSTQSQYTNGFPSSEDTTPSPHRLTTPDWYPVNPAFDTSVLTSVESCTAATCTHSGLSLTIGSPTVLPGAYDAAYSPDGTKVVYVQGSGRIHRIWVTPANLAGTPTMLTTGTDPDWQPIPVP